ncbi:TnsD family transposase [Vibrio vulnificus]|nr:TniQ family protein [Vibrio vulnificus]MCU8399174.1 TnsD family transposase [Vibrio vulnificus]
MFLKPIEGECVYGLVARHHAASALRSLREKNRQLLSRSDVRINPQLPCMITRISDVLNIESEQLLMDGTAYPIVISTLANDEDRTKLRNAMLSDSGTQIATLSRSASSQLHFNHVLKYCPQCSETDRKKFGHGVWYIMHQLHGVLICPIHRCWLINTPLDAEGINRRFELPPTPYDLPPIDNATSYESALRLSRFAYSWREFAKIHQPAPLYEAHNFWLRNHGYLTDKGQIRQSQLKQHLYCYWQPLFSTHNSLIPRDLAQFTFLYGLLSKSSNRHYLKHALLAAYFSESAAEYFEYPTEVPPTIINYAETGEPDSNKIIHLLKQGMSLRSVAAATGYSVNYIAATAERENISFKHRFKQLNYALIDRIIRLAYRGMHRKEISKICKVSVGTVEQKINAIKGLAEWRRRLRFFTKRFEAREALRTYTKSHPDATRNQVKNGTNSYNWLFRHDKNWLNQHLPKRLPHKFYAATDWHKLDVAIAKEIHGTIHCAKSLSHVDRQLKNRPSLLAHRTQLPLSIAAAAKILEKSK